MTGRENIAERMRALTARGAAELDGAGAIEVVRWVDENLSGSYVVASSMKDAVLIDLAARVRPGVHVMFVDTGYHFAETIGTRHAIEALYDITVIDVRPEHSPVEQDALMGKDLFATEPHECCRLRKVVPMSHALRGYCAWLTGLRRADSATRADAPVISYDAAFGILKVNPLAEWTDDQLQAYIEANGVLVNPLVHEGYPSIGCAPCTSIPQEGADPRSGRWAGRAKTECGLHASRGG
jgi:phosphoadenosine phosphosulfate reductase